MKRRVYIRPGFTDMRKSIDSLCYMVHYEMNLDVYENSLFVFCNKRRDTIKILYWDKKGFCLWHKKLSKERFPWINTKEEVKELSRQKFFWLLRGIDFFKEHTVKNYKSI